MRKISTRIMVAMIAVSLILTAGIGITAFVISRQALQTEVEQKLVYQSLDAAANMQLTMGQIEASVDALARSAGGAVNVSKFKLNNETEEAYAKDYFRQLDSMVEEYAYLLESNIDAYVVFAPEFSDENVYTSTYVLNEDGVTYNKLEDPLPNFLFEDTSDPAFSWYHGPVEAGQGVWSKIY